MRRTAAFLALAGLACCSAASALEVRVLDPAGEPVADVVVVLRPLDFRPRPLPADHPHAQMDQRNRAFVPHVLAVEAGTWVDFPNNDSVSHQVYSFSPARRFQLPLYKGAVHPPVLFDKPGVVTLGCNIHDNMLGYIFVADSPWFGMTDGDGRWSSGELPAGRYDLRVWSPRLRDPQALLERRLELSGTDTPAVTFQLTRRLKAEPGQARELQPWDDY